MKRLTTIVLLFIVSMLIVACEPISPLVMEMATETPPPPIPPTATPVVGCVDADYPDWETSPYVLPFPVGETYKVNLSNCSSSYHAAGRNDALAYDFAMAPGTLITAARAGTVIFVEERGKGGERNNLVVVKHEDKTSAQYMHLQQNGALVEVGDVVEQGDEIGLSGATGLAGYPHLHFIVTKGSWKWPYKGVPVTFSNTTPNPTGLASNTEYTALPYP